MDPPTLRLSASGLLSKWGFNDGDEPEAFMDYWDEIGVPYWDTDWRKALRILVRRHLLPELERHHRIVVYDIETSHNPIRAEMLDGVEVDDHADVKMTLTPEFVEIPYEAVMEAVRQSSAE